MYPNIGKPEVFSVIKNGGGFVKAPMQHMPWGDRILLEKAFLIFPDGSRKHQLLLPGVIFRPNRDLARRTKGASTHQIYTDAYEAQRGAEHTVKNYGVRSKERATETGDLKADVKTLREYVIFLLCMGPHMEHVLRDLHLGMTDLAVRYSWKFDENKKKATEQMIRGLVEKDSLGRKNIPAAAMSMGGAVWNLLEREEVVQWLSMHMDQRAIQTERLIDEHICLYQQLWDLVGKESSIHELISGSDHETLPARTRLKKLYDQLAAVSLRPFVKNAKHTARDVAEVLDILKIGSREHERNLKEQSIRRLREGIRWVFVLDALQRGIIFPLSYLIEDLLRQERLNRRRTKAKSRVIITSSMAPEKFYDLGSRIAEFQAKLAKCKDGVLVHPVKDEILALLAIADNHIAKVDDWRLVKQDLDAIAEIL
ncbi:MAG: hypothetical protein P1P90_06090 [Patescibacteria group bacterium]|nr:hypothetical protein [Patescibacteria group bacterium]